MKIKEGDSCWIESPEDGSRINMLVDMVGENEIGEYIILGILDGRLKGQFSYIYVAEIDETLKFE